MWPWASFRSLIGIPIVDVILAVVARGLASSLFRKTTILLELGVKELVAGKPGNFASCHWWVAVKACGANDKVAQMAAIEYVPR
jgi:hypothetical protein